jgi:hypothetical protein
MRDDDDGGGGGGGGGTLFVMGENVGRPGADVLLCMMTRARGA